MSTMMGKDNSIKGKSLMLGEGSSMEFHLKLLSLHITVVIVPMEDIMEIFLLTMEATKGNSFRGRGRNNYGSSSRFNVVSSNSSAGILGPARPYVYTYLDITMMFIYVKSAIKEGM